MTIWTTIDPISNLALFAGLTAAMPRTERRRIAWRASLYAAIILVVAVVIGQIVHDAMGIRLRSLQVAGGLILQHRMVSLVQWNKLYRRLRNGGFSYVCLTAFDKGFV